MASGLEDMRKEYSSMAGGEETASEKKAEVLPEEGSAADLFGNFGLISVLFETPSGFTPSGFTPSGFAIIGYDGNKLTRTDAWQHVWADFVDELRTVVWVKDFLTCEDKRCAINKTYLSPDLISMIKLHVVDGQTLAVGNEDYKNVIEDCLEIPCIYNRVVKELMWGLRVQIRCFLPAENSEMTDEDRFPMSEGMIFLLDYYNFDINPHMMVTKHIIRMAGIVYECDRCVDKYDSLLRSAAEHLMKISSIDTRQWGLMKLATALKMICDPEDEISDATWLFSKRHLERLKTDAPLYKDIISKNPFLKVYKKMYSARKMRLKASRVLTKLLYRAKMTYEDEQAGKAASYREIGPDRKKICPGLEPIDELTEWHSTLSAESKERQVPPTMAPVDALQRCTQISSHQLYSLCLTFSENAKSFKS